MKRRTIFHGLIAVGFVGLTGLATSPAMAVQQDVAEGQGDARIELRIERPISATETRATEIKVAGERWNREVNRYGENQYGEYATRPMETAGTFSKEIATDIRHYVTSGDLVAMNGIKVKLKCDDKPVSHFKLTAGAVSIDYPVCGLGFPEGEGSFAKLVKLLDVATAR
nr:hypothetical protein [Longispora sp. (in: high G+C Gram-positive bacteria)]